jgi:meiotically up-regulated gene 157 (Mug157) protein
MTLGRRELLRRAAAGAAGVAASPGSWAEAQDRPGRRPAPDARRFTSEAVEATIAEVRRDMADAELAWLFANCFPNTLDTTVRPGTHEGAGDTFVITGDIPAMWLRDSSAQVWPYLPLARDDRALRELLAGVIRRQARCILLDPYANAFNDGPGQSEWMSDLTDMRPELHERKWEVDSLCYPLRLAHGYVTATGDASVLGDTFWRAVRLIVETFRVQQRRAGKGPYRFQRRTAVAYDTVPLGGYGNPTRPNGLVHSIFRPSDDACVYPMLVPSNLFAVRALRLTAALTGADGGLAREARQLADDIEGAAREHALVRHPRHGRVWAYEVDGFGNALLMDDANVPSLLALPYLGVCDAGDATYRATRRLVLSTDNPYFFRGAAGEGIGGPHVGLDMVWPLGIIMRALTATDDAEIVLCLGMLKSTHAGTGFMHEAFHKDDAAHFTRAWFAWANTLFGELIVTLHRERPHLLRRPLPA